MTISISGVSAPALFRESLYKIRIYADPEESRNGDVYTVQQPVVLNLWNPTKRVITDPTRNANPFFHVMEFVWMMAGSNDIQWIAHFNKQMLAYSDDGKIQRGAYGYRWRNHFGIDQIETAIRMLQKNHNDRRVVIGMWDPQEDLESQSVDVPCNTQLMFRVVGGCLDMTIINRSNDLIWGALGANIVHMTFLQELISNAVGIPCGEYKVFTNNLHIYKSVPNFEYYWSGTPNDRDIYLREVRNHVPLLAKGETYAKFVLDCEDFVDGYRGRFRTDWMHKVAMPVIDSWISRTDIDLETITDDAWRIACTEWVGRRRAAVADKQLDNYTRLASREQEPYRVESSPIQSAPLADVGSCESNVGTDSSQSCTDGNVSP